MSTNSSKLPSVIKVYYIQLKIKYSVDNWVDNRHHCCLPGNVIKT